MTKRYKVVALTGLISEGRTMRTIWATDSRDLAIERAKDFDGNVANKYEETEVLDTQSHTPNLVIWTGWHKSTNKARLEAHDDQA